VIYFSYGSNLLPQRLQERVGVATFLEVGWLPDRRLAFQKIGRDGSAKCDAAEDASSESRVWGALYEVDRDGIGRLDEVEGVGRGYLRRALVVMTGYDRIPTEAYIAQPAFVDSELLPFGWYRDLVLAGARFHGFPTAYCEAIAKVESREDPDRLRSAVNRRIVGRAP